VYDKAKRDVLSLLAAFTVARVSGIISLYPQTSGTGLSYGLVQGIVGIKGVIVGFCFALSPGAETVAASDAMALMAWQRGLVLMGSRSL
jgi:hypothetical protein